MPDNAQVTNILRELKGLDEVLSSIVVSRSGMHIAGDAPDGVHLETFVAMSAILLGSAETAVSEIRGDLQDVFIELDRSRVIINSAGAKALLVIVTKTKDNLQDLLPHLRQASQSIASVLAS